MEEEFVTKSIVSFLKANGYLIYSFDFPQSGTGILLRPDKSSGKSEGIKPDIIAAKGRTLLIMENKGKFWKGDFEKLHNLKHSGDYRTALQHIHIDMGTDRITVGIGIPNNPKYTKRALNLKQMVDLIITVDTSGACEVIWGDI